MQELVKSGLHITNSTDLTDTFVGFFEANIQKLATLEV